MGTAAIVERLFGRRTGRHTHPVTHPRWLEFSDTDCAVCAAQRRAAPGAVA